MFFRYILFRGLIDILDLGKYRRIFCRIIDGLRVIVIYEILFVFGVRVREIVGIFFIFWF